MPCDNRLSRVLLVVVIGWRILRCSLLAARHHLPQVVAVELDDVGGVKVLTLSAGVVDDGGMGEELAVARVVAVAVAVAVVPAPVAVAALHPIQSRDQVIEARVGLCLILDNCIEPGVDVCLLVANVLHVRVDGIEPGVHSLETAAGRDGVVVFFVVRLVGWWSGSPSSGVVGWHVVDVGLGGVAAFGGFGAGHLRKKCCGRKRRSWSIEEIVDFIDTLNVSPLFVSGFARLLQRAL